MLQEDNYVEIENQQVACNDCAKNNYTSKSNNALQDEDKDDVVKVIMRNARTGEKGNFGDGRIFISQVLDAYTISTAKQGL